MDKCLNLSQQFKTQLAFVECVFSLLYLQWGWNLQRLASVTTALTGGYDLSTGEEWANLEGKQELLRL